MIQKSETNIIEVIRDNIDKQKCLKVGEMYIISHIYICNGNSNRIYYIPSEKLQNYISPVAKDMHIEMQTAELLAGLMEHLVHKFITTDEYKNSDYIFIDTKPEN